MAQRSKLGGGRRAGGSKLVKRRERLQKLYKSQMRSLWATQRRLVATNALAAQILIQITQIQDRNKQLRRNLKAAIRLERAERLKKGKPQ